MSKASRLKRAHKKKARPVRIVPTTHGGSRRLMKRMSAEYPDVLQNIEFALVTNWRENGQVDDAAVAEALRAALRGEPAAGDPRVEAMVEDLASMREGRSDVPDHTWRDALLTVLQSVRRHSCCRPGERKYLRFTDRFIL